MPSAIRCAQWDERLAGEKRCRLAGWDEMLKEQGCLVHEILNGMRCLVKMSRWECTCTYMYGHLK